MESAMTTARKQLVCLESTPYYHCVSRCVRRSFLCGEDAFSGKSYEHRRNWIEKKIYSLAEIYCIDVCAYAVMNNHYHLVLHIDKEKAENLSLSGVVARWSNDHKLPSLILRWQQNVVLAKEEREICVRIIEGWRGRLYNLSWFMKELNYDIACKANKEDDCKGHFWESRFKSQALMDDQALAAAMVYVDLNPIRSGKSNTPETSEYTSIKARLESLKKQQESAPGLFVFIGSGISNILKGMPFSLNDYIELVNWSAKQCQGEKMISSGMLSPPLLKQFDLSRNNWLKVCTNIEKSRVTLIGCPHSISRNQYLTKRKRACALEIEVN